jgi:hypothetical protein
MTKQEQTKLIKSFLNSMKKDILDKVEKLPENWDGWEIKHWIAEKFDSEDLLSRNKNQLSSVKKWKRRECENDILINNL